MTIIQLIVSGLLAGAVFALLSVGLTLVFGVMRVINLAQGDLVILGTYIAIGLNAWLKLNPYVSLFIILPSFFLLGALIYQGLLNPVMRRSRSATNQVVVTFGLALIIVNAITLKAGSQGQVVNISISTESWHLHGIYIGIPQFIAFAGSMAGLAVIWALLKLTYFGKAMRATAQDRDAARLLGVATSRINLVSFGLATAAAGAAGAMLSPILIVNPQVDGTFTLLAYVVVVLGGLGSVGGAVIGGLLVGLVQSFTGYYVDPQLDQVGYLAVFLLVLILRPSGLMGLRGYEALEE
jgi:branched-chain amino acid transport system permease protein